MRFSVWVALIVVAGILAGCGQETPPAPGKDEGPQKTPEELQKLLVGTWDYLMRYPSGDELPTVRVLNEDGTGNQYNKDAGPASKQDFTWKISEDGKTLKLAFSEIMVSTKRSMNWIGRRQCLTPHQYRQSVTHVVFRTLLSRTDSPTKTVSCSWDTMKQWRHRSVYMRAASRYPP